MTDIALPTQEQARVLTDRIKVAVEGTWQLIREAYITRTWAVLGYNTWDDYCNAEFGQTRLRLPREERQEIVASLRESGLSIRAIASATRTSVNTVQADLQVSQSDTPVEITGADGKTYAASRPASESNVWVEPGADGEDDEPEPIEAEIVDEPVTDISSPTPQPPRAPDRTPRVDVSRTVLVALTELRQVRESLQALTAAQLARQDEETRRIWAARLNAELEALHDFHNYLIKENNQ